MSDTPEERRENESKILSVFLRKSMDRSKKIDDVSLCASSSDSAPVGESLSVGGKIDSRTDKTPMSNLSPNAAKAPLPLDSPEAAEDEYPHLSPETAQLVRKMTDPARRVPIRTLRQTLHALESKNEPAEPTAPSIAPPIASPTEPMAEPLGPEPIIESPTEPPTEPPSEPPFETMAEPPSETLNPPSAPIAVPAAEPLWQPIIENDYFRMEPEQGAVLPGTDVETSRSGKSQHTASDLVVVSDLHKGYVKGKTLIPVLRGVDFTVKNGEYLSIVGQSGSGKSTLLHLMGTLDVPDRGSIHFDGQRIDNLPNRQRDTLRNRYIGMIFQFYHLIPEMTMIENVLAPLMIRESVFGYFSKRSRYRARAKELLEMVGLGHRIRHKPSELSGGEMQRTAIARALITEPRILLADEPTGNLDSRTSSEIVKLLRSLNRERKLTIIMVTHDTAQAEEADRYIRLVDGQIAEMVQNKVTDHGR